MGRMGGFGLFPALALWYQFALLNKRCAMSPLRILLLAILSAAWAVPAISSAEAPRAAHVVLVSIDGLRPEFYLDSQWPAPLIQQMAVEGAHAEAVRGIFPSVTYPSHATIVTGAMPARHGIAYNSPFEPDGQTGRWYWEFDALRSTTLWEIAGEAGYTTANISWPTTVGAPIDYNIPQIWPLDGSIDRVGIVRERENPEGFLAELERGATGALTDQVFRMGDLTLEDRTGAMAAYTLETHKPNFMTVHHVHTDHYQHRHGRDGPMVRRAVAAVDRAIGQMIDAAARAGILEQTTFIVTGDHGFVDIHTQLAPNTWLVDAGLMEAEDDRGDWRATFHTTGAAAFLHLRDPDDASTLAEVRAILDDLPPAQRRLFRIVERDELDAVGTAPAAAFALSPKPGVTVSARATGQPIASAEGGTHGYFPDFDNIHTGFIAWGAGVKSGAVAPIIGMEDIAPLIAALLGLEFETPDGVLYPGLLSD